MRPELVMLLAMGVQGLWTGLHPLWSLLLAGLVAALWKVGPLRHGLASVALGGLGMLGGAAVDQAIGLAPACHGGSPASLSTVGMVGACMLGCVWVCGMSGRRPGLGFHALVVVAMLAGEEAGRAALTGVDWPPHWPAVLGMGLGTAVGALAAGLLLPDPTATLDQGPADSAQLG